MCSIVVGYSYIDFGLPLILNRHQPLTFTDMSVIFSYHALNALAFAERSLDGNVQTKNQDDPNFFLYRIYKFLNPYRRTAESIYEVFGLPFEIDRLGLAYGYLDWKKYTGNPLVKAANH